MRLEAFIIDLLYEHDCVVLPDFGGLVANYRSARLNRKSHVISPPSKHIGFNRNLKTNDGLLTSHVAAVLDISYKEANRRVDDAINDYQQILSTEGRLMLEKVGVFFKDKGGQLQFIPEEQENYLLSSFGLTSIHLRPVEQNKENLETPVVPIMDTKRRVKAWQIAAAIILPVLFAGTLLVRNQIKQNPDFSFASLNPFHEERIVAEYAPLADFNETQISKAAVNPLLGILETASENVKYDFVSEMVAVKGIVIDCTKKVTASAVSTEVKPEAKPIRDKIVQGEKSTKYAVIGGAFQVMDNADNFLEKLKSEGFDAAYAGKRDGLQLVAYGFYASQSEAKKAMENIKASGSHAWIKRK